MTATERNPELPTTVVVPLDGSARSRGALVLARSLANCFGARITTVTVDGTDARDVDVHLHGAPADELHGHLHRTPGTTVVCMTSHGRGGLGRRLVGSVAEELIRNSPAPVVVMGPRTAAVTSGPRSILAGVAWPPGPDRLIALLTAWAPALTATVELAHVRSPAAAELYVERVTGAGPPDRPDLGQLAARLVDRGVDVRATQLMGPHPDVALRRRADGLPGPVLLAVDSHHHDHDPDHDIAYRLIRHARWPVLATTGTR